MSYLRFSYSIDWQTNKSTPPRPTQIIMPLQPEALELLSRIARSLESQNGALPPEMGLIDLPKTQYLYVGRQEDKADPSCWYRWKDERASPVSATALRGELVDIQINKTTFKGKDSIKLDLYMKCHSQQYCVRSGIDTMFSRSVLLALNEIEDINAANPIVIGVRASKEDENIVFGSVLIGQQPIKALWDKDADMMQLAHHLIQKFGFGQAEEVLYVATKQAVPIPRKQLETAFFNVFNQLQRHGVNKEQLIGCAKSLFPYFTTTPEMPDEDFGKLIAHLESWAQSLPIHY
jgi:hypothetical protein